MLNEVNPNILFTGAKLNDRRVATILHRWESNQFVDPPTVEIFAENKCNLCFSDGRHRSKTCFILGSKKIPIAIHKSQVDSISKIIELIAT